MTSTQITSADRPEPIRDALSKVAYGLGSLVGLVTLLGTLGVLNTAQVEAVTGYAAQVKDTLTAVASPVAGLIAGGAVVAGILRAGRHATGNSTPSDDPRDRDGVPLMRVDGKPLGGVELGPVAVPPAAAGESGYGDHAARGPLA